MEHRHSQVSISSYIAVKEKGHYLIPRNLSLHPLVPPFYPQLPQSLTRLLAHLPTRPLPPLHTQPEKKRKEKWQIVKSLDICKVDRENWRRTSLFRKKFLSYPPLMENRWQTQQFTQSPGGCLLY